MEKKTEEQLFLEQRISDLRHGKSLRDDQSCKPPRRELRTRMHLHHMVTAEPGTVAVSIVRDNEGGVDTYRNSVPAWGVYDIYEDLYIDGDLEKKEFSRTRSAGPLVWIEPTDGAEAVGTHDKEDGLVPVEYLFGFRRLECRGVSLTQSSASVVEDGKTVEYVNGVPVKPSPGNSKPSDPSKPPEDMFRQLSNLLNSNERTAAAYQALVVIDHRDLLGMMSFFQELAEMYRVYVQIGNDHARTDQEDAERVRIGEQLARLTLNAVGWRSDPVPRY